MNQKRSYEYQLNGELQNSASQLGQLEKDITHSLSNDTQVDKLITKTSELDNLTVRDTHGNFLYSIIWIGLIIIAGMILFHFLL